ncbi:MAG: PAS domain S-box protein [Epsilonproteobacteria bacterium]|nr:PAS domain S-box protein [Campylobacterota bacterium]
MKNLRNADISINDIPSDVFICRFIDDSFTVVDANDAALHAIGLPKKSIIGKDILELLQDIEESDFLTILREAQNSSEMLEFNIPCYIHDNLCRWHKGSVKSLFNGDLILYYKNIEREKELEIEDLQYQLDLISEAPYVGICIFDNKFLYVNQVLENMLGYTLEELQNITPIDLLHLQNKEEHIHNLQKRLSGESFTTSYLDAQILRKDNRKVFVRLCVKTIQYKGRYRALASVIDITSIVAQEQKTKRLAQALEQTDDLLLMTDREGRMIHVNKRLMKKMGYSKEELLGKKTSVFKSGKHDRRFYKRLWNSILSGKKYKNIIINRTKKGRLVYLDTRITPVFDQEGKIESFVATSKDISYHVKTKTRLRNLAMVDSLTKILNRYVIEKEIEYHLSIAERHGVPFSVLMIDIDYFKKINDTYGHYVGDIVLKEIAKTLRKSVRKIDKIGRWGWRRVCCYFTCDFRRESFEKS